VNSERKVKFTEKGGRPKNEEARKTLQEMKKLKEKKKAG
jgi:hypothetical protein